MDEPISNGCRVCVYGTRWITASFLMEGRLYNTRTHAHTYTHTHTQVDDRDDTGLNICLLFLSESVLKVVCRLTPSLSVTHFHTEMQHFDNNCFSLACLCLSTLISILYFVALNNVTSIACETVCKCK
jgi:hypothetical protein